MGGQTPVPGTAGDDSSAALRRWQDFTQVPLLIGAAGYLVAYSWIIIEPDMPAALRATLITTLGIIWIIFVVDIVVRLGLTPRSGRTAFIRRNPVDVLAAVIPILRPFTLLRHLRQVPGFRGDRRASLRTRFVANVIAYELMFVYVIALAVLAVERDAPDAHIVTVGDSLWWACVTVATVGYGDFVPVTSTGRMLAVALMGGGIIITGTVSATLVSSLTDRVGMLPRTGPGDD